MNKRTILVLLALTLTFISCSDNGNELELPGISTVYVTNEGNFSDSNGSITSYNPDMNNAIQKVFENSTGRPLAGIIQSASIIDDKIYIVLNNADKIEVVDAETFASVGTIELTNTPVAIVPSSEGQAYVSNLYDNSISIIDLESLEESGETIPVGTNPQAMVRVENRVFVANNGFGNDSTISVINTQSGTVEKTITVGNGPNKLLVDESNQIWVSCNGLMAYDDDFNREPENDVPGSVHIIDGGDAVAVGSIPTGGHPNGLALNEQQGRGYLLNAGVEIIDLNSREVLVDKISDRSFNSISYSPSEQLIYVGQTNGYTQPGQAIRYNLNGTAVDSFTTGIAPNGFHFLLSD